MTKSARPSVPSCWRDRSLIRPLACEVVGCSPPVFAAASRPPTRLLSPLFCGAVAVSAICRAKPAPMEHIAPGAQSAWSISSTDAVQLVLYPDASVLGLFCGVVAVSVIYRVQPAPVTQSALDAQSFVVVHFFHRCSPVGAVSRRSSAHLSVLHSSFWTWRAALF